MRSEIKTSPHPAFPSGRPVEIGSRFLIVPEGAPSQEILPEQNVRIPVLLARGRAFGSGLHETTVSCLETLEKVTLQADHTVLDFGTGTGILAIATLLLGARNAVAVDIDSEAVKTCSRNAVFNNLRDRTMVVHGTLDALDPSTEFDLVLANIHGNIILDNAQQLVSHTRDKGHLILSGLDYSDNQPVKRAMSSQGMEKVSVCFLEEYVTQVWRRHLNREQAKP